MPLTLWSALASAVVVSVATATDLRSRRIPNPLTFPAVAFGLVFNGLRGGWEGLLLSVSGLLLAPCILTLLHGGNGPGKGDIKLVAALGAILGPSMGATLVLVSAVVGGFLAAFWIIGPWFAFSFRQFFHRLTPLSPREDAGQDQDDRPSVLGRVPYGVAISIGTLLTLVVAWSRGGRAWPF